ncbi:Autophagy-related protein 2-like protein A [Auxenochlorella protothecoides]|uniref:Autophagy-related protein 2 n=1 Tax=Auxenochlorella protothecoides TaxID=3075 RepID=A0A087SRG2_AUXPR|nr:Autophagy-related protein 2-like protein A [Auxenochlorella protothecoides]KFM28316.1 Autophagy-related protein 2-like protein A [Auxenochlorella protothecoides]
MFAATTWALKRLLKFVLKRNLKQWIATEIDLDQVEVQLGQGSLELREVLLNVDYINQQLDHTHWEVVTAFVGCIRAYIPLASLYQDSCSIQLVDVFLTVQPRAQPGPAPHAPGAAPGTPRPPPPAPADGVSDGIRIIAGGLESLVQRLQVQASNIVGRVLLPSQHSSTPPALLVLTLEQLSYTGAEPEASSLTSAPRSTRSVDFRGLALGAKGCGGTMSVTLGLGQGCGTPHPTASLGLTMGGLAADLTAGGLATLDRLATVLRGMLGAGGQAPGTKGAGPEPCREQHDPPGAWASRSLLESLMLPDCEDLVLEAFAGAESELEVPPDEEVSDPDFWDARSQTASFCSTSSRFQSVYSSDSRTGSVWSSAGASMQTAATPALAAPEKTLSRLHDLTASIREVAAPLQWSLSAKLPRVQATLPYPGTDDQLVLSFEHVSLQLRGQAPCILAGLTLQTLELVEERSAAVDVAEDQHMTACCSLPSSVGPCPDYARPGPYDPDESPLKSTLEQLSDLHIPDRAGTEARPSSTAAYPFLFCSGSDAQGLSRSGAAADERAALTLFCQSGGSGTGWDTHVHLAPLSCWLNLPAAERLLAAVERLAVGMHDCAPAPEVAGCGVAVSPSTLSPAVSSQSLGTDRQSSISLPELEPSLSIHCSQLCLLVPLPLSACASGLDGSSAWPGPGSCLALITSLGCGDPLVHAQAMQGVREVDSADCKPELAALHHSSALTLVVRRAPPARLSQVFTSLQLAGCGVWRSSEPEALLTSLEASTRQECTHALRASGLHVHLDLDPARLAPLAPLLEACLGLLPAPTLPGVELATQNCLSLDAAARLTLRDAADRPLFHAEVAGFHAFFVAGLGRVPGASAAVLTLDGADLACAQTGDLLLHGGGPGASGPTLALLHLSRQSDVGVK